MTIKPIISLSMALAAATVTSAQVAQPDIVRVVFPESAFIMGLSDNGDWAVACGAGEDQSLSAYPYLVDARTGALTQLWDDNNPVAGGIAVNDVTNDGNVIVGSYNGYPSYYNVATNTWTRLPGSTGGAAYKVTPDGSRIAGWGASENFSSDNYAETPLYWERQDDGTYRAVDVYAEFANFPRRDDNGSATPMVRIENMSADGNIVAGAINYIYPTEACYYVYDRTTQTTTYVDTQIPSRTSGSFADQSAMSNNGTYLAGHMQIAISGEYTSAYLYNIANQSLTIYDSSTDEHDRGGTAVTNSGVVLACSPAVNPLRYAYVRYNNIWFGLDELLYSRYGINFYDRTGYDYTGLIVGVSDDETVLAGMSLTASDGYIIRLKETLSEACSSVNPLDTYAFSPASGSQFARFRSVTLTFGSPVNLTRGTMATLNDANGNMVRRYSISANADGYSFNIGGIPTALTAGAAYTLTIPAGAFTLASDASYASDELSVTYVGRANTPVTMLQAAPAEGANVSELSTNNPVQMAFDMAVTVADGAVGYLYEDGNDTPITELSLSATSNILTLSPSLRRYLSSGVAYTVVLPDSSVTDIMGDCGNTRVELHYTGVYEPEISTDGNLFFDDFDDPSQSMAIYLLYEGDHNSPNVAMQAFGFDADNNPWNMTLRENSESTDYCAGSHSMYNPAGASDDWMSLPQLNIENADYWLSFDAQGYHLDKTDRLQVIVLEEDGGYTQFTTDLYEAFNTRGVTIYDEVVSPGVDEENLSGEWTSVNLSLAQFAGKSIYIAFVNRNENQSMVFVNNIRVYYNGDFYFMPTTPSTVVAQESANVGVQLRITGNNTYNDLTATLTAQNGDYRDTYAATGLGLSSQSGNYTFSFPNAMPMTIGEDNRFTITINLDGDSVSQTSTISNLAFETTKHVVVEEGTGQWCGNCPLGLVALENMERLFGDRVIPIGVHGGTGYDLYLYPNYTSYLGFSAWPAGIVNRIDTIYSPMYTAGGGYEFNSPEGNSTFLDIAQREFEQVAEADITVSEAVYDTERQAVRIAGNVNYALTRTGLNNNICFVVIESGMQGMQNNYFYSTENENLGAFGAGGIYGSNAPTITFNDVARRVLGELYSGVAGLVPVSVTANQPNNFEVYYSLPENVENWGNAEVVAMLINANTGRVVNATKLGFTPGIANSIDGISSANGEVSISGGVGLVNAQLPAGATATVYDLSGTVIATATASDAQTIALPTGGRSGLMIVSVKGDGISKQSKVIVR